MSLILALRRLRQDNQEGDTIYQLWSTAGLERDSQNLIGLSMGRELEEAWPGCLCSSSWMRSLVAVGLVDTSGAAQLNLAAH